MHEGGIIKNNHSADISYQTPVERIATNFTVATSEILANPHIVFEKLWNNAPAFANMQVANMMGSISNATAAIDNSYDIGELTPEIFLSMIERLEITFQSNGAPNLPQIVSGTAMMEKFVRMKPLWEANPEYAERMTKIIDKKRIQWNERQASRKLVE
jgi:hypothetical protein